MLTISSSWYFFAIFFEGFQRLFLSHFFKNLTPYYLDSFFYSCLFYSGVKAPECLKTCVNCVFKFQLFFLNISSKVPAGVNISLQWTSVTWPCTDSKKCSPIAINLMVRRLCKANPIYWVCYWKSNDSCSQAHSRLVNQNWP